MDYISEEKMVLWLNFLNECSWQYCEKETRRRGFFVKQVSGPTWFEHTWTKLVREALQGFWRVLTFHHVALQASRHRRFSRSESNYLNKNKQQRERPHHQDHDLTRDKTWLRVASNSEPLEKQMEGDFTKTATQNESKEELGTRRRGLRSAQGPPAEAGNPIHDETPWTLALG